MGTQDLTRPSTNPPHYYEACPDRVTSNEKMGEKGLSGEKTTTEVAPGKDAGRDAPNEPKFGRWMVSLEKESNMLIREISYYGI